MHFSFPSMVAVRALAVTALLAAAGCGGSVELVGNLNEPEANEVLGALGEAGITAQKVPGKDGVMAVTVPQAAVSQSIALMREAGLPRERRATMGDVFRKEGLISSPLEERARYLWALSQELSETISQVDGVLKARVHVVLPERGVGAEPPMPSSAAVFVKHRRGYALEPVVPEIRRLVASSIPGLSGDKVTVVLVPAAPKASAEVTRTVRKEPKPAAALGKVPAPALAAGGGAALVLAGAVAWFAVRQRRARAAPGAPA